MAVFEKLFSQLGTRFSGLWRRCEVETRVNSWTAVRQDRKKGHGREVAVSEGSIVVEKNLDITKPRTNTGGTSV